MRYHLQRSAEVLDPETMQPVPHRASGDSTAALVGVVRDGGPVTVDAAVSNDLYYPDHFPAQLDLLVITAPDGSTVKRPSS